MAAEKADYHCNLCVKKFKCKSAKIQHISDVHGYFKDIISPGASLEMVQGEPSPPQQFLGGLKYPGKFTKAFNYYQKKFSPGISKS